MITLDTEQERLLQAATVLFERFGYKKTTVEDIALEAGIGKGTVYLRFPSKADLGIAWAQSLQEEMWSQFMRSELTDPAERLAEFLSVRVMVRYDLFQRFRRSFEEGLEALAPRVQIHIAEFQEREAHFVKSLISAGIESGTFQSPEPLIDSRTLILATNSLIFYRKRPEEVPERDIVDLQATTLARFLVRALRKSNV